MKYLINAPCLLIMIYRISQVLVSGQRATVARIRPEAGIWGHERGWTYCSSKKWAIGFRLKVEADSASSDDTAMNAMELVCADTFKDNSEYIKAIEGYWGTWGEYSYCPDINDFLSSVNFSIEAPIVGDDTAANDVQFQCSKSNYLVKVNNGERWGTWRPTVSCPIGSAICGFSLLWEDYKLGGDDTAANGAIFDCCELDPCLPNPCKNKGTCTWNGETSVYIKPNYTCHCKSGYEGSLCETRIDPCRSQPCQNGATCKDISDGINYSCFCEHTSFSGKNCDEPCVNGKKCLNGGSCQHNGCYCNAAYEGSNCELIKDPCKSEPCHNKGVCISDGLSYRCNCELTGYQGVYCENPCNNNVPCYNNATCNNNVCACPTAFEGPTCETLKLSCDRSPCKNGAPCFFNESGLHCDCQSTGWQGKLCDQSCFNDLPCENGGVCSNSKCICKLPFAGVNCAQLVEATAVGKCNVWGDPHLKMFGQYPGAIRDQYICSDSGSFPLLVNRFINATVTTTPDHPWFIFEYYISFFGISGKLLCSLSHLNTLGCENNSIIMVNKSRSSLNIKYLNNYLRVTITSLVNRTITPEVKYYNIEIELDYYSVIGESTGLCVSAMDGCKFEIQNRRRKREINFLRKLQATNEEKTTSQMAGQICQFFIDETTKRIPKLNISTSALISHYIIEDLLTACIFDLQTTGLKELAASNIHVIMSEGMMFLPVMNDTAYTIFWNEGQQLMNEVVQEVDHKFGTFFEQDI